MNRKLWTLAFGKNSCPPWPCPTCKTGHITLIAKDLKRKETISSLRAHKEEDWDPDFIFYSFTAWGKCLKCEEEFAISGTGGVEPDYDGEGSFTWDDYYFPKYCQPMPDIFEIPSKCPDEVSSELRASFKLFWTYPPACVARIRVAIERLMDSLGLPKRKKDKNGKFYDLSLHARIEIFSKKETQVGAQLMALKWIGNTGSHDSEITQSDILDAFEIMEHALGEIISSRSKHVAELARKLTKKHSR